MKPYSRTPGNPTRGTEPTPPVHQAPIIEHPFDISNIAVPTDKLPRKG